MARALADRFKERGTVIGYRTCFNRVVKPHIASISAGRKQQGARLPTTAPLRGRSTPGISLSRSAATTPEKVQRIRDALAHLVCVDSFHASVCLTSGEVTLLGTRLGKGPHKYVHVYGCIDAAGNRSALRFVPPNTKHKTGQEVGFTCEDYWKQARRPNAPAC